MKFLKEEERNKGKKMLERGNKTTKERKEWRCEEVREKEGETEFCLEFF